MSNLQIYNQPDLYINNLVVSWASNTTLTVSAGAARDSGNNNDIVLSNAVTVNAAINGANGLDKGALANNTWYAIYAIAASTGSGVPAVILSTSASTPTLPFGYDVFRRIGWALTDGSSHLLNFTAYGSGTTRKYIWDSTITVLTNSGTTTYTNVSLASAVPPTSTLAYLNFSFNPNAPGDIALFRKNGSSSSTNLTISAVVIGQNTFGQIMVGTDSSQIIQYRTSVGTDALSLFVSGFEDYL